MVMLPSDVFTVEVSHFSWGFGLLSWGEFDRLVTRGRGFRDPGHGLGVDRSQGKGRKPIRNVACWDILRGFHNGCRNNPNKLFWLRMWLRKEGVLVMR